MAFGDGVVQQFEQLQQLRSWRQPMTAQSIPADLFLSAIREAGVQDVVLVPDTHQRTVLDLLMADDEIRHRALLNRRTRPLPSRPD